MATIREQAAEAWERSKASNKAMRQHQAEQLRERLVGLGLREEAFVAEPGCVCAAFEGLTFRDGYCGIEVRDHDWPKGVWKTFHNLADLGGALATSTEEEEQDLLPCVEDRVASALERIADALEAGREV